MAPDNSYRPNVYREQGGDALVVRSGGTLELATGSKWTRSVRTATQALSPDGSDSGITIISQVANLNHTLPNATAAKGGQYRFVLGTGGLAATGGAGLKVHSQAADKIVGGGLAAATNNILQLSGATDAAGDFVDVVSDGGGSWHIVGIQGGWAMTTATA